MPHKDLTPVALSQSVTACEIWPLAAVPVCLGLHQRKAKLVHWRVRVLLGHPVHNRPLLPATPPLGPDCINLCHFS